MSILTGPEIRRLAEPVTVGRLGRDDYVWRGGRPLRVVAASTDLRTDFTDVLFAYPDGGRGWEQVKNAEPLTRCGAVGERIAISPFDPARCGPCSYDVSLGDQLRVYDLPKWFDTYFAIDPRNPPPTKAVPFTRRPDGAEDGWILEPGIGYLGVIRERIVAHKLVPDVSGRSSIGRVFVSIHQTAGWGDPDFAGYMTLEIVVPQPVVLRPGDVIGQVRFTTLVGEYQPYRGRYQNQPAEPVPSRFHLADERIAAVRATGGSDWDGVADPDEMLGRK